MNKEGEKVQEKRKQKILIFMEDLRGGGAEKVLTTILSNLEYEKYDVKLLLMFNQGIYLSSINKNVKIETVFKKMSPSIFYKIYRAILFRIFKKIPRLFIKKYIKEDYNVAIGFLEGYTTKIVAEINSEKNNLKKIAWVHTDLEKRQTLKSSEEKRAYGKVDKIICVSEASKQSVSNLYPEYSKKIKVIYNPVDKDEIIKKSKEPIEKSNNKITVVSVGRLGEEKGYDILLETHRQLLSEGLDYDLKIIGEGKLKGVFEKYIEENKIKNNTKFLGFKKNPYPYMKNADIFVVSSRFEGYSLVLAEAIILEKPIIATKCTGPTEILENGKYGMLVPTEDVVTLKNAMREMIKEKELRKKYSKLSAERSSFFDIKKTTVQINLLLSEI